MAKLAHSLAAYALASLASLASIAGCGSPSPSAVAPTLSASSTKLGSYTSSAAGFDTHSFYFDTGREVVVFDAQFTEGSARELIAKIKAETKSPITHLVVTHPNPDKFNGANEFRKIGAKV